HLGKRRAEPLARTIASTLVKARQRHDACPGLSDARYAQELERIANHFQNMNQWIDQEWSVALEAAVAERDSLPNRIEEKTSRLRVRNEQLHHLQLERLDRNHREKVEQL